VVLGLLRSGDPADSHRAPGEFSVEIQPHNGGYFGRDSRDRPVGVAGIRGLAGAGAKFGRNIANGWSMSFAANALRGAAVPIWFS